MKRIDVDMVFFRLLKHNDKQAALAAAVESVRAGTLAPEVFAVAPSSFEQVPGSPFAYWVSERVRKLYSTMEPCEGGGRELRVGGQTSDDFRFLRLHWEADLTSDREWKPYQKGGGYSRFYSDIPLVADWDSKRQTYRGFYGRIGRASEHPSSYQYFFRAGITWSRRSQRGLSLRVLPEGCIFSDKGPVIFGERSELPSILGLTNSTVYHALVSLQMAFGSYEVGVLQRTPLPTLDVPAGKELARLAQSCVALKRTLDANDEISHAFILPSVLISAGATLVDRFGTYQDRVATVEGELKNNQTTIDELAFQLYGITGADRDAVDIVMGDQLQQIEGDEASDEDGDRDATNGDSCSFVLDLVSYSIGCAVGRWDARTFTREYPPEQDQDLFTPLPVCSPGMLTGIEGRPAKETPSDYPLRIEWDGIMVDDPDHPSDVVRRVREVLEVIWKDRAEAIEKEACEILGVKELREYFRKPGSGGFWDDHVKRYSKSRRKAPIYWLLQSSKKNYAVWLYCHRLNKDTLFKLLINTVEPKVKNADRELGELRTRRTTATGKEIKQLDRQIEKQDAFVSELRDFEDKLRRTAELQLVPDLNDGVVLTIAPLRELVPWKEAKAYWDELMAGEYAWSSIGNQLREKEMAK